MSILLRGGSVVDPIDGQYDADVLITDDRITAIAVSPPTDTEVDQVIDAAGQLIMPGGIDAHSHTEARIFDDDVQLALLRSGVTTVITGQDGVSFAPGDGRYAADYFGPLNGHHPHYRGGGVRDLLDGWDGVTRLNVGYLVPAGTVRHEVMGRDPRTPTRRELEAMIDLVRAGLADGALGLSSGLDYVPGAFATPDELAALCAPVADAGRVYASHIRGYEENTLPAVDELIGICATSGVAGHVSHFHARPELIAEALERAERAGVRLSWDAYPYFRGFSLLSMVLLPKDLVTRGAAEAAAVLRDPERLPDLVAEFNRRAETDTNLGPGWADRLRIASTGTAAADVEGLTLAEAGRQHDQDPVLFGYRLLADSELAATTVMEIPKPRVDSDLARQFALPGACSGSDGIFLGGAPHPRAYGCGARMLGVFGRERADFSWPELAAIMSGNAARRFGLAGRGRVAEGAVADLILVDPSTVGDRADYERPTELSIGIGTALVRGRPVLQDGRLSDDRPGGALRAS